MSSPGWTRARRSLVCCWRDPSASPDTAARYRGRQFQALVHQLPISNVGSVLAGTAITALFWDQANHLVLVGWLWSFVALAAADLVVWWRRRSVPTDTPATQRAVWLLAGGMALTALLYAILGVYLFNLSNGRDRLVLTAVMAALIATGSWLFACLPQAGVGWATVLCAGLAVGLAVTQGHTYGVLAPLLCFFGVVMVATVLVTSRMFVAGLMAETEIERQKELLGLLLHDFEESASDWLWETDEQARLTRVSPRLGDMFGTAPGELQGRSIVDVLAQQAGLTSGEPSPHLDELAANLAGTRPFHGLVVPAIVDGEARWWSLTAKPLDDATGTFAGWRGVGSDITEVRRREEEMARLANFDTLTGLANRHQFLSRLEGYVERERQELSPCTLMLLDLDNFKAVNDSLGHVAGDELLVEASLRMAEVAGAEGTLARLGGDEFALLIHGHLNPERVEHLGSRLQARLAQPHDLGGRRVDIRASIGVAFGPQDASDPADLLKAADMALYAAKAAGRQTLRFFDRQMDEAAQEKLAILSDLHEALERGEFELHYQPQLDLESRSTVGFEALLRWRHPVQGMIPPERFIPVAEESGFILQLGAWTLTKACADAAAWPGDLKVAVNVAARQFSEYDLLEAVESALRQSGLPSHRLEVEITESTLVSDSEAVLVVMRMLRQIGVRVAVDDFGTGYSSLSYLRTFPLDKLKIDQSFIGRLTGDPNSVTDRAIVRAIVELARTLDFETVAEGIEQDEQCRVLSSMGCQFGQGYLFSPPLGPDAMAELMAKRRPPEYDELVR